MQCEKALGEDGLNKSSIVSREGRMERPRVAGRPGGGEEGISSARDGETMCSLGWSVADVLLVFAKMERLKHA